MDFGRYDALASDDAHAVGFIEPDTKLPAIGSDKKPVEFYLYSPESETLKARHKRIMDRRRARSDDNDGIESDGEAQAYLDELTAAYIGGWTDNWTLHGEAMPYSEANAVKLVRSGMGVVIRDSMGEWRKNWKAVVLASSARRENTDAGAAASTAGKKPASPRKKNSA